jgi:uncharacterized protein YpuA (DUF1002 family)
MDINIEISKAQDDIEQEVDEELEDLEKQYKADITLNKIVDAVRDYTRLP